MAERQDDGTAAEQYAMAEEVLAGAGYAHYELSSWARPGHASRHNAAYWLAKIARNRQRDRENMARLVEQGWTVLGVTERPIKGPEGNVEFLLGAKKNG